jgi:hypothetical protein
MPIEITEMVIRVNVSDQQPGQETSSAGPVNEESLRQLKKEIIKECTQQVLEQLRLMQQR